MLEINYDSLRSKFARDSFSYHEVAFLDYYFKLRYLENYKRFFDIRKAVREHEQKKNDTQPWEHFSI